MDDSRIVQLYWQRSRQAIPATAEKYGAYCASIANNILGSREDAEECVNDTWWKAWNAMPPHRPAALGAFLGKITRNLSIKRWQKNHAAKRGGGQTPQVLDELEECVSGPDSVERELDRRELAEAVNAFLGGLSEEKRGMFVCRYWYFDGISDIARRFGKSKGQVSTALCRLRGDLRRYLTERGFEL